MTFLLQRHNKALVYDFEFALTQAKSFYDWSQTGGHLELRPVDSEDPLVSNPDNHVPVGSVSFVSNFLLKYYPQAKAALLPLNVPKCLFGFADRRIVNVYTVEDMRIFDEEFKDSELFRKSMSLIKAETNGMHVYDSATDFVGCQVSEPIRIDSEWRVFVFNERILHVANYSGDCLTFPDAGTITAMVKRYSGEAPVAYTLDVGVNDKGTFVIECHRFFSCGLYGFSDYAKLPAMLSQTWYQMRTIR